MYNLLAFNHYVYGGAFNSDMLGLIVLRERSVIILLPCGHPHQLHVLSSQTKGWNAHALIFFSMMEVCAGGYRLTRGSMDAEGRTRP